MRRTKVISILLAGMIILSTPAQAAKTIKEYISSITPNEKTQSLIYRSCGSI